MNPAVDVEIDSVLTLVVVGTAKRERGPGLRGKWAIDVTEIGLSAKWWAEKELRHQGQVLTQEFQDALFAAYKEEIEKAVVDATRDAEGERDE